MGDVFGSSPSVDYQKPREYAEKGYETSARQYLSNLFGNQAQQGGSLMGQSMGQSGQLSQGYLPASYQANYEKGIGSAVNNTVGNAVNSLAQRGVLNSTYARDALASIGDSVSNAAAQNYNGAMSTANNVNNSAFMQGQGGVSGLQNLYNTWNANRMNLSTPGQYVVTGGSSGILGGLGYSLGGLFK